MCPKGWRLAGVGNVCVGDTIIVDGDRRTLTAEDMDKTIEFHGRILEPADHHTEVTP